MPTLFNQSLNHAVPASDLQLGLVVGLRVAYQHYTDITVKTVLLTASWDAGRDVPLLRVTCNSTVKF